jgi:hypothetical protein
MPRQELSREELFALVWEKPTREVAKDLGVSDVAIGKLCTRLQVPKPPRGYWARIQSGQTRRRPPLAAFREEIDRNRREAARVRAAESLSKLQLQFYEAALSDLRARGVEVEGAKVRGSRLPELDPAIATQILLLIQNRAQDWIKEGKVTARWGHSIQGSMAKLVEKLLPLARPQVIVFESEGNRAWYTAKGPVVFVRLTVQLQEQIANLVHLVRHQRLRHVVMPLIATDHAWSAHHIYTPESHMLLDSTLCVSTSEIWVESMRRAWREEDPPERFATGRIRLEAIMPIDYMPAREIALPNVISKATAAPYQKRLRGLIEAERVLEMVSRAAYSVERAVPDATLAIADRLWFGESRPFLSAQQAWRSLEVELERWETELEAQRTALAQSILGIEVGDIVTTQSDGRLVRLSVTGTTLYVSDKDVTFLVNGTRFRKDGTLGKLQETIRLHFENGTVAAK